MVPLVAVAEVSGEPSTSAGRATLNEALAVGPSALPVRDMTVGDLLAWAAMTAPDRLALVAGTVNAEARREWTYADLYSQSLRVARALHARFKPGEHVAVWAPSVPEWVMLQFGAAMAGLVLVPVDPGGSAADVELLVKQARAVGVVVCTNFRGQSMLAQVQALAPRCRALREVIRLDRWNAFVAGGDDAAAELPTLHCDDVVMLQYTAATSGPAKGALLHHRGLVNNAAHVADRLAVHDGDVWIGSMSLHHAGGCVLTVLGAVSKRATLVLAEHYEPPLLLELIDSYGGNALLAPPGTLAALLAHPDAAKRELSSLRVVGSGGTQVPPALVARWQEQLGVVCCVIYGQTESSPGCAMTRSDDSAADQCHTVGTALPGVQLRIVSLGTGNTAAVGEEGEICTRGYHVMKGYHELEAATQHAVDADGWLHTGDLGALDARGYLRFAGRLKAVIVRGEVHVHPSAQTPGLAAHPAALVPGAPVPNFGGGQDPEVQAARTLHPGHAGGSVARPAH